jgi:hypothetical protein
MTCDPYHHQGFGNYANQLQGNQNGLHWQAAQATQNYPSALANYGPGAANPFSLASFAAAVNAGAGVPSPSPEPIEDAGITLGEIVAYRIWVVTKSGFLKSTAMDTIWAPDEPMSGDVSDAGVHAWKSKSAALTYGEGWFSGRSVFGSVLLWGDVIEHETGYRAEFASIASIDECLGQQGLSLKEMKALRQRYGLTTGASVTEPTKASSPETIARSGLVSRFIGGILGTSRR